jgi:hypothetical protein
VAEFFSQQKPLVTQVSIGAANDKNIVEVTFKDDPKV